MQILRRELEEKEMDNHDELERVLDETDGRIQHLKDLLVSE
jgi:hypothetical protein